MNALIEQHRSEIESLCQRYGVKRLELFGSAASGEFDPVRSDVDFLVDFHETGYRGSARRYFGLLHGLEDLLGRRVDLVEIPAVTNPYFLQQASRQKVVLYAA